MDRNGGLPGHSYNEREISIEKKPVPVITLFGDQSI